MTGETGNSTKIMDDFANNLGLAWFEGQKYLCPEKLDCAGEDSVLDIVGEKNSDNAAEPGWADPVDYLRNILPDEPVALFCPEHLRTRVHQFMEGFPGQVTYAVKANPDPGVLLTLAEEGITAFDVASPAEMELVRKHVPAAILHYNNPVRSVVEVEMAVAMGVHAYAVDSISELDKLTTRLPSEGIEVSVRFKLPVTGAAYDFGSKFGADPEQAADLLAQVVRRGYTPALCFHPGTQCTKPRVWKTYIQAAGAIANRAGVKIARLNVGGGFPSHRMVEEKPALEPIFEEIGEAMRATFGAGAPQLVCEPGRGMVGDAYALLCRIKAIRDHKAVFLNDGIYGGLAEHTSIGLVDRLEVFSPRGVRRTRKAKGFSLFGPTCDSIDELGKNQQLPADIAEGDYVVFYGMGAYSGCLSTGFNGYGVAGGACVASLACSAKAE